MNSYGIGGNEGEMKGERKERKRKVESMIWSKRKIRGRGIEMMLMKENF